MISWTSGMRLSAFNRQVLQMQEEAYTLAYYLLGNAECATQTVEEAFLQAFGQSREVPGRISLLHLVLSACKADRSVNQPARLIDPILSVPLEERQAILLVDVLGLSYNEAAQVIGTNTSQVSRLLSQGRLIAGRSLSL
jgi:DNA-directed RNA polymerase specialized sigma24 family protein